MTSHLGMIVVALLAATAIGCEGHTPRAGEPIATATAIDQQQIYVADWANHRIVRMSDMRGKEWTTYGGGQAGELKLQFPVGVCADAHNRIFVSQQSHDQIHCLNGAAKSESQTFTLEETTLGPANKYAGSWIGLDAAGHIYSTYDGEHRIVRMDDITGAGRITFGREGSGDGEFRYPAGIAIDQSGRIYVADFDNFRLVRMDDMRGTNWVTLGEYGSGRGQFINPCGVCLDREERIYIADQGNDRLVRMDDMQGKNWTSIGSFGAAREAGRLYAPTGVCVDRAGRIYVTQSSSNHCLVRMDDMNGKNWTVFGTGGSGWGQFASPMGVCVR